MKQKSFDRKTLKLMEAVGFERSAPDSRFEYFFTDGFLIASTRSAHGLPIRSATHSHEEYEFLIPLSPIPCLVKNGNVYYGDVDRIYPIDSGSVHGIKNSIENAAYMSIVIEKSYFERLLHSKGFENSPCKAISSGPDAFFALTDIFINEFKKGDGADCENVLEPLKHLICAKLIDLANETAIRTFPKAKIYQKGLRNALQYINENYDKDINVDDLAAICGLSHSYFSSCFKKAFDETPKVYINGLRIEKAKYYLKYTSVPVTQIAELSGFCHFNTFASAFKNVVGMTPNEYRNN